MMNGGNGETSYANNSSLQRTVISKARSVLHSTLKDMFKGTFPKCMSIADLGCSSGPNTLLVVKDIIETIFETCNQNDCSSPEFLVLLNDLPNNDFNNIFRNLPDHFNEIKEGKGDMFGPCFVSAVPGSFYERLFPSCMLHFVHSSYSLHWLSKVPDGLEDNKGNIYLGRLSPPSIHKAYHEQFQRDFSRFLSLRSVELVPEGRMVLTLIGRSTPEPTSKDCCFLWELLSKSLLDLMAEGLVEEKAIDLFNIPLYTPYQEEVRKIIEEEGSFSLDKLDIFEVNWDPNEDVNNKDFVFNKHQSGQLVANYTRAVMEPIFSTHFEGAIMNLLFSKFKNYVADHLEIEKLKWVNIVVSVSKM